MNDIVEAAANVAEHLGSCTEEEFTTHRTLRAAVLHELTVIGEAAARLPTDLRGRHALVPWSDVVAFRNVVVHEYFGLSWRLVWVTATTDVPALRRQVEAVLASEFPEQG